MRLSTHLDGENENEKQKTIRRLFPFQQQVSITGALFFLPPLTRSREIKNTHTHTKKKKKTVACQVRSAIYIYASSLTAFLSVQFECTGVRDNVTKKKKRKKSIDRRFINRVFFFFKCLCTRFPDLGSFSFCSHYSATVYIYIRICVCACVRVCNTTPSQTASIIEIRLFGPFCVNVGKSLFFILLDPQREKKKEKVKVMLLRWRGQ